MLRRLLKKLLRKIKKKFFSVPDTNPTANDPPPVNHSNKPESQFNPNPQCDTDNHEPNHHHGVNHPEPNLTYWQPLFDPSIPTHTYFEQEVGAHGWGNNEAQMYTQNLANCFFTPDNKLVVRAISQPNAADDKYTSARLVSRQTLARDRGCVTASLTAPSAPGIWPAFWMLPAKPSTWPVDGEVDICELWNGNALNHSCVHWGHYNDQDKEKHRVIETTMNAPTALHQYSFVWEQEPGGAGGRMLWYIDACPVMRASIPDGIRPLRDFQIILNVAMGGNVCQDRLPAEGVYDLVVHDLKLMEEPHGGWEAFNRDWECTTEGHPMK